MSLAVELAEHFLLMAKPQRLLPQHHGLLTGEAVWVDDTIKLSLTEAKVIRKVNDTTFTFQIASATAVSDSSVTFYDIGPDITKPSTIEKIVHAEIEGVQLMILTEGELNAAVLEDNYFRTVYRRCFWNSA